MTPPRKPPDSDPPNAPEFEDDVTSRTRLSKIEQEILRTRERLHRLSNLATAHGERLDGLDDLKIGEKLTAIVVEQAAMKARLYAVAGVLAVLVPPATAVVLKVLKI